MPIVFAAAGVVVAIVGGVVFMGYFVMRKAYLQELAKRDSRIIDEDGTFPKFKSNRNASEGTDIARDLNSQLSAKTIVLEKLIADSQKQIDRMEELLDQIEKARRDH
jgi:BioD-like phosphotransacetylase family protein